jgi:hypothetical protein
MQVFVDLVVYERSFLYNTEGGTDLIVYGCCVPYDIDDGHRSSSVRTDNGHKSVASRKPFLRIQAEGQA